MVGCFIFKAFGTIAELKEAVHGADKVPNAVRAGCYGRLMEDADNLELAVRTFCRRDPNFVLWHETVERPDRFFFVLNRRKVFLAVRQKSGTSVIPVTLPTSPVRGDHYQISSSSIIERCCCVLGPVQFLNRFTV